MVLLLFSLMLLVSKDVNAVLSLIQPSSDSAQFNSSSRLSPNGTLGSGPKKPSRLTNLYVQPPVAVDFDGYGDFISRSTADVCLYIALDHALSTRDHSSLAPIDASRLGYTSANVSLNFHPIGMVIWEEWKNALYLLLKFVDEFETREFFFVLEVLRSNEDWYVAGKGHLVNF